MEVRVVALDNRFHITVWDSFYPPEVKTKLREFGFKYDRSYKSWSLETALEEIKIIYNALKSEANVSFTFIATTPEKGRVETNSWEEFEKIQKEEEKNHD